MGVLLLTLRLTLFNIKTKQFQSQYTPHLYQLAAKVNSVYCKLEISHLVIIKFI